MVQKKIGIIYIIDQNRGWCIQCTIDTAAYLRQHNNVLCIGNVQKISGGSAGDPKIEDHEGICLGLKGINSFPA